MKDSPSLILRDTHDAKAYNEELLMKLVTKNAARISNIIICTVVFVTAFCLLIIVSFFVSYLSSKSFM